MANTRRRTQRPSRTNTRTAARTAGPSAATLEADAKMHASNVVSWERELRYINKDLRELSIVTVICFAMLFLVGFFL